ncbi:MAG: DNA topoisomerase IV subunit A [Culicoidibacterales bacterium]
MSNKIISTGLQQLIGERFGRYSRYIIQDRALPDVRDGLKPVQRRILFAMYKDANHHQNAYRKSAKTVGNVIGNYHPHGDSSVYEAMVRMSQTWKLRAPLIDMHGNNGSVDGDPAAAMRYTEARLAKISSVILQDIDRQTVDFIPNFDDTMLEPTVLPSRIPTLLINGATGISAGYATDIPPHNMNEILDATIFLLKNKRAALDELMEIVQGPDFPTGGIVQGKDGLRQAFETGKGKVVVRSRYTIESKSGKDRIIISEIPYEVNKATLVKSIDEIRVDKKIEGIAEVRDESDREGLQIVVELKKDANSEQIINYLLKNTDMQINYNYNMVAIAEGRPLLLGLKEILTHYNDHQVEVITRRSQYDLKRARKRQHILAGLIRTLSILDEVLAAIRASKDKADAKKNLVEQFEFTEAQAEAIVMLQLYRLTNTDVVSLENENAELQSQIQELEKILSDESYLKKVLIRELEAIKNEYAESNMRKTKFEAEIAEIKIDERALISIKEGMVTFSRDGYVKFVSQRSYASSKGDITGLKEGDALITLQKATTDQVFVAFTNTGMYYYLPLRILAESKWKDVGTHIGNFIQGSADEKFVFATVIEEKSTQSIIVMATKLGMVKRSFVEDLHLQRFKKQAVAMKLKQGDEIVLVSLSTEDGHISMLSNDGLGVTFKEADVPITGLKTAGVIGMRLKADDMVCGALSYDKQDIVIITSRGVFKRMSYQHLPVLGRGAKGQLWVKKVKSNPLEPIALLPYDKTLEIGLQTNHTFEIQTMPDLAISDFNAIGSQVYEHVQFIQIIQSDAVIENEKQIVHEEEVEVDIRKELDKIRKSENFTIDDFLK